MNDDAISSILIIAVLLLFSAYFSATETAFSSLNRTRLRAMAEKGNSKAALALSLAEKYDQLLSSILVGNNVVNIAMSSISTLLFVRLMPDIGATVSTIVITIVVLIFGEISPKSLAKENPEKFAMVSAPIIRVVIWVLTPINFLFTQWKKLLGRIFKGGDAHRMTQDELLMLVDEASQEGGIDQSEGELLRSAIEFTDQDAEDILTHRVDLEAVPITATKEEVAAVFSETQYSRLPVYDGSIDNIVGILHQKDFYIGTGISPKPLNALMKEPIFVPPTVKIRDLLKVLQKHKSHIAVVSDEYGGTLGIVTMEDILEELVGETNTMRSWKTSSPPASTAAKCWAPPIWTNWLSALIWRSPPSALQSAAGSWRSWAASRMRATASTIKTCTSPSPLPTATGSWPSRSRRNPRRRNSLTKPTQKRIEFPLSALLSPAFMS